MDSFLTNLPAIITLVVIAGFLAYTGVRIGVRFLVRRIAGLFFVLFGVTFITFIMGYFAPGSAVTQQLGVHINQPGAKKNLLHFYHLDLPWYKQYLYFIEQLLHGSLGDSFINRGESVLSILMRGVPVSAQLGLSALFVTLVIGIPLGMLAAVRANKATDTVIQSVALTLYALPSFVLIAFFQVAMIQLYNHGLPNLPTSGWNFPNLATITAPILIVAAVGFAYYTRLTRTSMLEVLRQDYVRTARAKGLNERTVILKHAFRNALIPLVTVLGPSIAYIVNGLFVVENLFNIPGIGNETVYSIEARDWPVLQGTVILLAVTVVLLNLATDVMYGMLDPRIKVA